MKEQQNKLQVKSLFYLTNMFFTSRLY